jgi:acetylornithine deacetylase/succinyl-diaminopimelate desuccinylase-like protein
MQGLAANAPAHSIRELLSAPKIKQAFQFIEGLGQRADDYMISICQVPAPPFKEDARAEYLRKLLELAGLRRVWRDQEGNVIAQRPGLNSHPRVIVSAHLDTVFPEGTDVKVRRQGKRLCAPGISDNACGLAALPLLAEALNAGPIETIGTIYFVATVGEEGEGNLRGVRHLFTRGEFSSGAEAFIAVDGPGLERITNRALGSRRYRIRITGPGGHSWGDFGIVNPVHALGRAIAQLAQYQAPARPRTTFNVGIIEGGSSVNAIPDSASMTVDIRSVSEEELNRLESHLRGAVQAAVREENLRGAATQTALKYQFELIGMRPSGQTPPESSIVRAAIECSRALGIEARLDCSSTDSNVPISLGLPAITIGAGGISGNCHTLSEWYEPCGRELGIKRLLLLVTSLAGCAQ